MTWLFLLARCGYAITVGSLFNFHFLVNYCTSWETVRILWHMNSKISAAKWLLFQLVQFHTNQLPYLLMSCWWHMLLVIINLLKTCLFSHLISWICASRLQGYFGILAWYWNVFGTFWIFFDICLTLYWSVQLF